MRLQPDSLPLQLKKKFLSVTVLYGNESFLIEESVKAISQAFEAQFSGEQETISIENTASWQKTRRKNSQSFAFFRKPFNDYSAVSN